MPAPSRTFGEAIQVCLRNYATFEGRASRSEYWWYLLFYTLLVMGVSMLGDTLAGLLVLALLLPSLAVQVRRLHDTNRSGWWLLLCLLPVLGTLILLVFYCLQGVDEGNQYDLPTPTSPVTPPTPPTPPAS